MKKRFLRLIQLAAIGLTIGLTVSGAEARKKSCEPVILAYVTSGTTIPVDPTVVTHINYAFGTVKPTFDGVNIQRPEYLQQIVQLKEQNPDLRVLLSIGGWGAGGFSEMASNDTLRAAFVRDCRQIVRDFRLDGIDLDWEYPGSSASGIASAPEDVDNFTRLMGELREALGKKKLLTFASAASAQHVDFPAVMPYVDFVNLMCYDMGRPSYGMHHSALYPSPRARWSIDQSVVAHREAGVPDQKIVVGVPFYAHANTRLGYSDFVSYTQATTIFPGARYVVDTVAGVPYVEDSTGQMLCVYDDPRSLRLKCRYVQQNGLRGVMYWEYASDDQQGSLRRAVYDAMRSDEE